jgi:hypothetical protein
MEYSFYSVMDSQGCVIVCLYVVTFPPRANVSNHWPLNVKKGLFRVEVLSSITLINNRVTTRVIKL